VTDTELELPQGWTETKLDDIATIKNGNTSITKKLFTTNGFFAYSAKGQDGFLPNAEWNGNGVVLSSIGAKCGKCFYATEKWTAISNTIVIQSNETFCLNKYLHHYLNDQRKWDLSGSAQPFISIKNVRSKIIPIPPLNEQKKIVSKIEELFSKINHIEKLLENSKVNLIKLRHSIIHSVLFEEWLKSDISNELTKVPLSTLLKEPLRGGRSSPVTKSNSGIPILKLSAVTYNDFSNSNIKLCDVGDHKIDNLWVKKKDILIERSNSPELVGISAIYEGDDDCFIFPDLMIRIRVDEHKILPNFLAIYLSSPKVRKYFQRNARSSQSSMPKISQTTINDLEILLPKITKQKEILKYLEYVSSKYDPLMKEIINNISILKTMRFSILQFAFQGKLVPQDPNDEPASVLLEKIKLKN
jgi:type I restriction enzyme, S subunit